MLRSLFVKMKSGTEHLNYGRSIIRHWGAAALLEQLKREPQRRTLSIFDLGCGHGTDLLNVRDEAAYRLSRIDGGADVELEMAGVEHHRPYIEECRRHKIATHKLDLERDPLPVDDGTLDVIIANQILEHTKEIFWITSECCRALRPGGVLVVGVPNLASLHNRLLLLVGQQPTPIQSMSAHVRGFTLPDLRSFMESGGYLQSKGHAGSNFYPLPPQLSMPLARLFPRLAWGLFVRFERSETKGTFLDCLNRDEEELLETPFYGSPINPVPESKRWKPKRSTATSSKRTITRSNTKSR